MNLKVMFAVTLLLLGALPALADATATTAIFNLTGGSYADTQGSGASLAGNGGTLGPDGYTFTAGQGLSLSAASSILNPNNYSIEMVFSASNTAGWVKLIDFGNLTSDKGLYLQNGTLYFYSVGSSTSVIAANALTNVIITRDGATNQFAAYVNGVNVMNFVDVWNWTAFTQNVAFFMQDDTVTSGHEASGGKVTLIRTYDGALNQAQVTFVDDDGGTLPSSVPEPTSLALLGPA